MNHRQYSKAINSFLSEYLDRYVLIGVMANGSENIVIRCHPNTTEASAEMERRIAEFLGRMKAERG